MSKADFEWNDKADPLRLLEADDPRFREPDRKVLGVTGTLFSGEEATVTIVCPAEGWVHMDTQYARKVVMMLVEVIASAEKHNKELGI